MLAEHTNHTLRVILDNDPEEEELMASEDAWIEIGGDRTIDIPFDEYLKDWPVHTEANHRSLVPDAF